jgi:hypothetical protein
MRTFRGQILVVLAALGSLSAQPSNAPTQSPLSADAIVGKLMAANARRAESLRGYSSRRTYHLHYHGLWGTSDAVMVVEATYTAPDKKDFRIISESGSKLLINHVLLKLLSSEEAAQLPQNRKDLEISPQNYDFSLDKKDSDPGSFYVLDLKPRSRSEYVYRGKIWVDAHDFAEARMNGEPQKSFSMWVNHTQVEYRWANQDGFWLPVHNESITRVRMGGSATLTIDYSDYQIQRNDRVASAPAQSGTVPDPSVVTNPPY